MADLPPIKLVPTGDFTNGSFVAPNAWHNVQAETPDGQAVGYVSYSVSPLNDRIYVDGLKVNQEFRERGYATSMLFAVAKQCSPGGAPDADDPAARGVRVHRILDKAAQRRSAWLGRDTGRSRLGNARRSEAMAAASAKPYSHAGSEADAAQRGAVSEGAEKARAGKVKRAETARVSALQFS